MRPRAVAAVVCALVLLGPATSRATPPLVLHLVAGGSVGDGSAAVEAVVGPTSVARDATGNLIVADARYNRIRKISPAGIISTIAGTGESGYSGDGGPAVQARLAAPRAVVVDASGAILVADTGNHVLRKIAGDGTISTFAGRGQASPSLYTGDAATGDNGPARAATLVSPTALAIESTGSFLVVADGRVRRINAQGIITTIADRNRISCSFGFRPYGVAVVGTDVLITEQGCGAVWRLHGAQTVRFAGGGASMEDGVAATTASLPTPSGIAFAGGVTYIGVEETGTVRTVDAGGIIRTIAGGGSQYPGDGLPGTEALLSTPVGLALGSNGSLLIADESSQRLRTLSTSGIISTIAGGGPRSSGDDGPAAQARLHAPQDICFDQSGNLYIAEVGRIRRVDTSGTITTVATNLEALSIAVDSDGTLYAGTRYQVLRLRPGNAPVAVAGTPDESGSRDDDIPALQAALFVDDIAVRSGFLYVSDRYSRVRKVDLSTGIITTFAGTKTRGFSGDGGPATQATLEFPTGIAFDGEGSLYVVDDRRRVRRVDSSGTISTVAEPSYSLPGEFVFPMNNVAVDRSGTIYVSVYDRMYQVSGGAWLRFAGTSPEPSNEGPTYGGAEGPAMLASLGILGGITCDATGAVYAADWWMDLIHKIS